MGKLSSSSSSSSSFFFCVHPELTKGIYLGTLQAKIFNKLSSDPDRKVREAICQTHLTLVLKVKKHLAPHLKFIMPNWLSCVYDPNKDVARLATEAFEALFPLL